MVGKWSPIRPQVVAELQCMLVYWHPHAGTDTITFKVLYSNSRSQ